MDILWGVIISLLAALGFFYVKDRKSVKSKEILNSSIKEKISETVKLAGHKSLADSIREFNRDDSKR